MLICILSLLVLSIFLNVVFYIKLMKANKMINDNIAETYKQNICAWSTFENVKK